LLHEHVFIDYLGLITAANILIAVILHRVSKKTFNWSGNQHHQTTIDDNESNRLNPSSSPVYSCKRHDPSQTTKRRTSVQVTRMLLAVTLSLIIFNIPNTLTFLFAKIYDTRQLLFGRSCSEITDDDIRLYKIGFYSSVIQDILSDLPHIVNFCLYCLAGKKFRSIFINEVTHFLVDLRLLKRQQNFAGHIDFVHTSSRPPSIRTRLINTWQRAFETKQRSNTCNDQLRTVCDSI
jgi:hypothetical protein